MGEKETPTQTQTPQNADPRAVLEAMKAKIEEIKAAKEAARAGVEDKFYAQEEDLLPPEIAELKYSSDPAEKKQYQKALEAAKAQFESKELEPHDMQIAALEDAYEKKAGEIDEAEKQKAIEEGRAAFLAENPDVDFAALSEFWRLDTTERQRKQIADATPAGDIKGFYAAVLGLMNGQAAQKSEEEGEGELPPQFEGSSVPAKEPVKGTGNDAYLASIGLRS